MNLLRTKGSGPSEEGSVLVMALAFLSLFGLAIAAVLGFAGTGFRTAASVHSRAEQQYAADAAVDGAINAIRGNVAVGKAGISSACFALPALVNNTAVSVQCLGRAGSGTATAGPGGGAVPAGSVLTLPTNATEGIVQTATSSVPISGNVTTNRVRNAPAGSVLTVQGTLTCRTVTGTGVVTATVVSCPAAIAPAAVDPAYAAAVTQAPARVLAPACPAGATAVFLPGTYQNATALNALTSGACANKTFHFTPGTYYFEFTSVAREWLINDATASVVGGTLTAAPFPSRCDLAAAGVQFIFGSDSRLAVTNGTLELCPLLSAGQRIAVYGVPTSTVATPATTPTVAATTSVNSGGFAYAPAAAAAVTDGAVATATITVNGGTAASTLTGFSNAAIPANAIISAATLDVSHWRQGAATGTVSLALTAGDAVVTTFAAATRTTLGITSVNVLAALSTPVKANGISVRYTASDAAAAGLMIPKLDGITLRVTYTIARLTASAGCLVTLPYSPAVATTCAVLRGAGGPTTRLAVKGSVYAPRAPVNFSMTGQTNVVAQRGVVARTLYLGMNPGVGYTGPLMSLPGGSSDRAVLFTASIAGVPALRADATFADGNGATPGAVVTVTAWSVLR